MAWSDVYISSIINELINKALDIKEAKMQNFKILFTTCLLSSLCLIVPAQHDFDSEWNKSEFFVFLVILFLILNGLFYYGYKNFQSNLLIRKYGLTIYLFFVILVLTVIGLEQDQSSIIPTLGIMLFCLVFFLPVLLILEIACYFLQKQIL